MSYSRNHSITVYLAAWTHLKITLKQRYGTWKKIANVFNPSFMDSDYKITYEIEMELAGRGNNNDFSSSKHFKIKT
jgi:hypothetical protein